MSKTSRNESNDSDSQDQVIATVDLGSNSFHMVIARVMHGEVRILDKLGEKVQLAAGLTKDKKLDEDSQKRALDCLSRFAERVKKMAPQAVWVVGTNTLRVAKNSQSFIQRAEHIIGHPISIVSGREEARLIYLGVSHTLADDLGNRLVIDIGGGSTEFIIGQRFEALQMESLYMGCVSYRNRFFEDGNITKADMSQAIMAASLDLINIGQRYRTTGWQQCVGSSGTIRAVAQALIDNGWSNGPITPKGLLKLSEKVISIGKSSQLEKIGVAKERQSVFVSGLSILIASFNILNIKSMEVSEGALREGLLYELIGRNTHENVQKRTINGLQKRYLVDEEHAEIVANTAFHLWQQLADNWQINQKECAELLRWSSMLHELGLAISHSQYHRHGAYIIRYADLAGFSRQSQQALAVLIRFHRRKINKQLFKEYCKEDNQRLKKLTVILRLSVLMQRARNQEDPAVMKVSGAADSINLRFPKGWLEKRSLMAADLDAEKKRLKKIAINFSFK